MKMHNLLIKHCQILKMLHASIHFCFFNQYLIFYRFVNLLIIGAKRKRGSAVCATLQCHDGIDTSTYNTSLFVIRNLKSVSRMSSKDKNNRELWICPIIAYDMHQIRWLASTDTIFLKAKNLYFLCYRNKVHSFASCINHCLMTI